MRNCKKCSATKPLDAFYKVRAGKETRDTTCKECRKAAVLAKRHANIGHFRKYDRSRGSRTKRGYVKEWRTRSRIKEQAHNRVTRALASGRISKPGSCEQCGTDNRSIHAHHDDYSKQLDVRWLCVACHQQWHAEHGEAKNADMEPLPRGHSAGT